MGVIQQNIESSGKFMPSITLQYTNLNEAGFEKLADEISKGFGTIFSKNSQHGVEHWLLEKKVSLDKIELFQGTEQLLMELGKESSILQRIPKLGKEYIKDLEGLSMSNMDEKKVKIFAVQFNPENSTKAYLGLLEIVCGYYQFELREKLLTGALVKVFEWLDIIEIYTIFEKALNFLLREAEDNKDIQFFKSR